MIFEKLKRYVNDMAKNRTNLQNAHCVDFTGLGLIFKSNRNSPEKMAKTKIVRHCVKSVQIQSFFWSVFSRIQTDYGEILRISPNSVQMRENRNQKKTPYLDTFHAV